MANHGRGRSGGLLDYFQVPDTLFRLRVSWRRPKPLMKIRGVSDPSGCFESCTPDADASRNRASARPTPHHGMPHLHAIRQQLCIKPTRQRLAPKETLSAISARHPEGTSGPARLCQSLNCVLEWVSLTPSVLGRLGEYRVQNLVRHQRVSLVDQILPPPRGHVNLRAPFKSH